LNTALEKEKDNFFFAYLKLASNKKLYSLDYKIKNGKSIYDVYLKSIEIDGTQKQLSKAVNTTSFDSKISH
jgi:hypothetical protein